MKRKYSVKTLTLTAFFSVLLGLFFAFKFDFSPKSIATDSPTQPVSLPTHLPPGNLPSLTELVKKVKPAVVNISSVKILRVQPNPFGVGNRDPFGDFFGRNFGAPREQTQNSLGSGFIIDKNGTILTNNHVVQNADEILVKLSDGRKFNAKVIGSDPKTDIAVIRIQNTHEGFPFVNLGNSDQLEVGEWVLAVGNPFGLGQTVTAGIVSAKGRVIGAGPYDDFIQTDASINPGNSGGPLFNLKGEVIGINTAIIASGQGIGFAIPISMAKNFIPQLIEKGKVARGYLGIGIQDVTPELAKSFGLSTEMGALIANVYPGGPANKAGIQPGDLVLSFNGKPIQNPHDLPVFVSQTAVHSQATVELLRKGEKKSLTVEVGELEQAEKELSQAEQTSNQLGIAVRDLQPEEKNQLNLKQGVLVVKVAPGSRAEWVGIRTGDLILEVNNSPVKNIFDYNNALNQIKNGEVLRVFIKRGNLTTFYAFKK